MRKCDIKPIPKKIVEKIKDIYEKELKKNLFLTPKYIRFYSYLTVWRKELVKVTVAIKKRYNKMVYKQVAIHGIHSDKCYVKDMAYRPFAGYKVGWYAEGFTYYPRVYEGCWREENDSTNNPYAPVVNKDILSKIPQYKYSGFNYFKESNILWFLRRYEQFPVVEYLVKIGLIELIYSKMILKKAMKDKDFRKWLARNREEIIKSRLDKNVIVMAFNHNAKLKQVQEYQDSRKALKHSKHLELIEELFGSNHKLFLEYITKQGTNLSSYSDYIDACIALNIDVHEEKNYRPYDFKYWHNMRIDQYATQKALEDEKKRKELYAKFLKISKKYVSLEHNKENEFICKIAKSIHELVKEGNALQHCVGRMNYDAKFAREESLIFFIRNKDTPDIPFVTVEYSLQKNKVLQCYGYDDSKPEQDVLNYVNDIWLPYANKKLKQLQRRINKKKLVA